MGLLDQILGGLAGNVLGRTPMGGSSGGATGRVLMALLPVVLSMLANRQGGTRAGSGHFGQDGANSSGGFGAGGSLGPLGGLGGLGGLGQIIEQFSRKGYGQQANSWVAAGPNQAIDAEAMTDVFGPAGLSAIASEAGLSENEARSGLAQLLPEVVDQLTPDGSLPGDEQLNTRIDAFARQVPR